MIVLDGAYVFDVEATRFHPVKVPISGMQTSERTVDVDGFAMPYFQQIFWAGLTSISRLPSTVVPTGLSESGLPIGIQIIGNAYSDRLTIQIAQGLEQLGFRFEPPQAYPA